ncbi:MAG: ABC transporter ATP-binding protein [Bacteroidota bacterium]
MQTAIQVENIEKAFGSVQAVNQLSFEVKPGELFGLIGPDGAGKTTLFKMLTSLLIPDAGSAQIVGYDTVRDYKKIRKIIGYMPGKFSLYQDLSVEENLNFFATIFGTSIRENYHLIEEIYVQIEPFKKRRAGKLSGGMKQKLALCCALIHQPEVLFLDEPTTGVDAVSRAEFWEMLKRIQAKGISILVSTPYMDEATLCDRIALMQNGKLLQIETPDAIRANYGSPLYAVRTHEFYRGLQELRQQDFAIRVEPFGEYLHLTTNPDITEIGIRQFLLKKGHEAIEIKAIPATIEDVFLQLM